MGADDWSDLLAEYEGRIETARSMGGAAKLDKQRANGRLDARSRIDQLCDAESFSELGTLVGGLSWGGLPPAPADGLVGGFGQINGRSVVVMSEDFSVKGGSIGLGAHAKRVRLAMLAKSEGIPLVMMLEGAGERATNGLQRYPYAPNDLQVLAELQGEVPILCLVMGASAGHGALSGLFSDVIIMTEHSALFTAGPPLVKAALGQEIDKQSLGGPKVHTEESGVAHNYVASETEAFTLARSILAYLPQNDAAPHPDPIVSDDTAPRRIDPILDLIPRKGSRPYDMRPVIALTLDDDSFTEIQPDYARNIVVGLGRLGGRALAVVANQPSVMAGTIDAKAAQKAARFIGRFGKFGLPFLFLTDNPGVLPGGTSEREGVLLAAAQMYSAQNALRTQKFHVTLRKAFGFGSSIMAMNPFDHQTLSLAFPGIALGGVPARGGDDAAKLSDEARRQIADMEERAAWGTGDSMAYDEIIDPRDLRNRLLTAIQLGD